MEKRLNRLNKQEMWQNKEKGNNIGKMSNFLLEPSGVYKVYIFCAGT